MSIILTNSCDPLDPLNEVERKTRGGDIVHVEKLNAVVLYNAHMGGVDRSDQLRSYYSVNRSSHKWYRYIFWFIFKVVLGNSFIVDKEKVNRSGRRTLCEFRMALAQQLIAGFSSRSDQKKRSQRALSLEGCIGPENSASHFISRREGRKRHCVQCKKDGRKTAINCAKETIYECAQCGVALCKETSFFYFNTL